MIESLDDYASFFLRLGFFRALGTDASSVAAHLRSKFTAEWGDPANFDKRFLRHWLLTYDTERVFFETLDAGAVAGDDAYCAILRGVTSISPSKLSLVSCDEVWGSNALCVNATTDLGVTIVANLDISNTNEGRIPLEFLGELAWQIRDGDSRLKVALFDDYFLCMWISDADAKRITEMLYMVFAI